MAIKQKPKNRKKAYKPKNVGFVHTHRCTAHLGELSILL